MRAALGGNLVANERQRRITEAWVRRFRESAADTVRPEEGLPPELQQLVARSYEAMISDLTHQLELYQALRAGRVRSFALEAFGQIGRLLIAARLARGWTQARLAAACGLKPQQIQRYEAREYANAKLDRIALVAAALEVELQGEAILPLPRTSSRRSTASSEQAAG